MDLYERLQEQLHGVIEIEDLSGEKRAMFLMDVWVKSVRSDGHIAAWQILAVILFFLSNSKRVNVETGRELVSAWEKVLCQRIASRHIPRISPRHPLTLLPLGELPEDLEWVIPIKQADYFLNEVGMDFNVTKFLEDRYNQAYVDRYGEKNTPETSQIPHSTTQESIPAPPLNRWPWGHHHTEALGHLEAAALRFWVNHDPTEPSTAPTNKEVVAWLRTEHKVSKTLAEAMASILRLDGLPTGPRK